MTLTDPRAALADQSNFIGYLVGLAGVARMVRTLADDDRRPDACRGPDDFVYVLLGLAGLGAAIERIAAPITAQQNPAVSALTSTTRWLR
ncbi:hypothetical protein [Mycobacterium sp. M23085]|uniref:hypothetical protein n=1 Tax=Mycobacterium sp. M23085 TaxID=3378087 RepID=UPI0038780271